MDGSCGKRIDSWITVDSVSVSWPGQICDKFHDWHSSRYMFYIGVRIKIHEARFRKRRRCLRTRWVRDLFQEWVGYGISSRNGVGSRQASIADGFRIWSVPGQIWVRDHFQEWHGFHGQYGYEINCKIDFSSDAVLGTVCVEVSMSSHNALEAIYFQSLYSQVKRYPLEKHWSYGTKSSGYALEAAHRFGQNIQWCSPNWWYIFTVFCKHT